MWERSTAMRRVLEQFLAPGTPDVGCLQGVRLPLSPRPPHPNLCKVPSAHLSAHLGLELLGEGGLVVTSRFCPGPL